MFSYRLILLRFYEIAKVFLERADKGYVTTKEPSMNSSKRFLEGQPSIEAVIHNWLSDLRESVNSVAEAEIDTTVRVVAGLSEPTSRVTLDMNFLADLYVLEIDVIEDFAHCDAQDAVLARFSSELEGWSRGDVNYRALVAENLPEAAAMFEEVERTKSEVLVACGVRVSYDGSSNEHVVVVSASASFTRAFTDGSKNLYNREIFFSTPEELYYSLLKVSNQVLDLF